METSFSVQSTSFLNQSGDISGQSLFTPPSPGLYRVHCYFESELSAGLFPAISISYTDAKAAQTINLADCGESPAGGSIGFGPFLANIASGDVDFSVTLGGTPPLPEYNLYFTVEKVG